MQMLALIGLIVHVLWTGHLVTAHQYQVAAITGVTAFLWAVIFLISKPLKDWD